MSEAVVTADGWLTLAGVRYRVALGRAGIRAEKEEGDGATPCGLLPLRRVLYRADRMPLPSVAVPREPIAPGDGWCDDPRHADYNRFVRLPHPARHEVLWREDGLYDLLAVLGWNDQQIVRHRGSAIFLHVAAPGLSPTEGCIALERTELQAVLRAGLTAIRVLPP